MVASTGACKRKASALRGRETERDDSISKRHTAWIPSSPDTEAPPSNKNNTPPTPKNKCGNNMWAFLLYVVSIYYKKLGGCLVLGEEINVSGSLYCLSPGIWVHDRYGL